MEAQERYNIIIDEIEVMISGTIDENGIEHYYSKKEIKDRAFEKANFFLDDRGRNVIFSFLCNITVNDYIEERRFVAAYKLLQENPDDIDRAIKLTGKNYAQRFGTEFNEWFDVTPDQVDKCMDIECIFPKMSWNTISYNQRADGLKKMYKLLDDESLLACNIARENHIDLRKAYRYVYDYLNIRFDNENVRIRNEDPEKNLNNTAVIELYFKFNLKFNEILLLMLAINLNVIDSNIDEYTKDYLIGISSYMETLCEGFQTAERLSHLDSERYKEGIREKYFYDAYVFFRNNCEYKYIGYDFALFLLRVDDREGDKIYENALDEMIYSNLNPEEVTINNYKIQYMKDKIKSKDTNKKKLKEKNVSKVEENENKYYKTWDRVQAEMNSKELTLNNNLDVNEYLAEKKRDKPFWLGCNQIKK